MRWSRRWGGQGGQSGRVCWGRGAGRTHLLLALVIGLLTMYPSRDGAPFLLLIETAPTFGRSVRFFHILHGKLFVYLLSFLFGRLSPPSPTNIAIVFSLLSNVLNFSISSPSIFLIFSCNTCRFSLYSSHSPTMWALLSSALPQRQLCAPSASSIRLTIYLFLLAGRSRSPTRKHSLSVFAQSIGPCQNVFISPISSFDPPYVSHCSVGGGGLGHGF